ncbi:hypothetical protein JTB14_013004 [Gonioctena quinquepunctata]|nr:hypothetical protein JTB14_013004 [Gonioctena quinquepunctata]
MSRKAKTDEEVQTIVKTLVFKLCSSDDFVNHITESILSTLSEKYEFRIEKLENENALLKSEVEELKMINSKVENDYNKSEYELKKKSLILFGLPEVNKEECSELIIDMAVNKIGININKNNIDSCYQIGKQVGGKTRPIIVKFVQLNIKQDIYKNKKLKGTGIVIREELTKKKMEIIKLLENKIGNNANVWTNSGNVFAKIKDKIIRFDHCKDLDTVG